MGPVSKVFFQARKIVSMAGIPNEPVSKIDLGYAVVPGWDKIG